MTVRTGIVRSDRQNRAVVVGSCSVCMLACIERGAHEGRSASLLSSPHKSMNRGRQNQHDNGNNLILAPVRLIDMSL
jgi:hypothetical protein